MVDMNDTVNCKDCNIRKELIDADAEDLYDWQKSILLFIDSHPKPKKYEIQEGFTNLIHPEDISDFLDAMCQEGILYKEYDHFHTTTYGSDLVKALKQKG